ncbi:metallophosphoesterase family protein [Bacillus pseudomycoides]|uniref:metallophosphoesterase family protein n=1 Tax=Bacillus pseudomycoides TaxID=64104 RepID=UPI000BEC3552|nr:metallophosphoesterase family protein [Bacillus pseudomycoides]PDY47251.1 metallophosphatase family protein [Bacillus pseudomycoides]PED05515.1 metallophosphatase family protein [Bacillus pseudomycoides]PED71514.1 metallophosphatase family protein [Bacillus pseudomycoides]PEI47196.1 metallophosphatase family protein [Bacillus pseudomycoides]PEI96345.1 metallophosphatase family protein [Bacillus pseudomycoides]
MDKIAVISDIHGNIPALEAVLEDIKLRGIERIMCLGDLVGKGPHSSEAIEVIRKECEHVVMGNWDDFITRPSEFETLQWHQKQLSEEQLNYLRELPFSIEFIMSGKLIRMFHASPRSLYERVQPGAPSEQRISLFENSDLTENIEGEREPDVVCYGDIHQAYVQNFRGKTLCNAGSVGNPLEITQASYLIFEGVYGQKEAASFSIQLVRVPYEIELAIRLAKEEEMPEIDAYIQELTTAKYRGLK